MVYHRKIGVGIQLWRTSGLNSCSCRENQEENASAFFASTQQVFIYIDENSPSSPQGRTVPVYSTTLQRIGAAISWPHWWHYSGFFPICPCLKDFIHFATQRLKIDICMLMSHCLIEAVPIKINKYSVIQAFWILLLFQLNILKHTHSQIWAD